MRLFGSSRRQMKLGSRTATTLAAFTLASMAACTVQKKEDAVSTGDTTAVAPAQSPPAAPAGVNGASGSTGTETVMPDSVTTSASKERTRDAVKTGRKPRGSPAGDTARTTGGERDSATQPMFELGADGKLHRIKR
jgi:hypothetical protein